MRNLKKVLSLTLALVMLLGMMVVGAGAAEYTDAGEIEYKEAAEVMSAIGVFNGTDGNKFDPQGNLTRAQAAKIITYMVLGQAVADKLPNTGSKFSDCPDGQWYVGSVNYLSDTGIVAGQGDGTFNPNGNVTGTEFAKMLLGVLGYDAVTEKFVNDPSWAANIAVCARQAGLDKDMTTQTVNAAALTRDQASMMAFNTLTSTMVYYEGGMDVTSPDGTTIKVGGNRKWVVNGTGTDFELSNPDSYMQFCEQYFPGLKLADSSATDRLGRPAKAWTWNSDEITAIAKEADHVFTKEIKKATDLPKALQRAAFSGGSGSSAWSAQLTINSDPSGAATLDSIVSNSGDGVKIEVFMNTNENIVTDVVVTNTVAVKVTKVDTKNETFTASGGVGTVSEDTQDGTFTNLIGQVEKDDVLAAVLNAKKEVVDLYIPESITGNVTFVSSKNVATIDGQSVANYKGLSVVSSSLVGTEVAAYMVNGYAIAVEAVDEAPNATGDGYIYVTNLWTQSASSVSDARAAFIRGVLADGTVATLRLGNNGTDGTTISNTDMKSKWGLSSSDNSTTVEFDAANTAAAGMAPVINPDATTGIAGSATANKLVQGLYYYYTGKGTEAGNVLLTIPKTGTVASVAENADTDGVKTTDARTHDGKLIASDVAMVWVSLSDDGETLSAELTGREAINKNKAYSYIVDTNGRAAVIFVDQTAKVSEDIVYLCNPAGTASFTDKDGKAQKGTRLSSYARGENEAETIIISSGYGDPGFYQLTENGGAFAATGYTHDTLKVKKAATAVYNNFLTYADDYIGTNSADISIKDALIVDTTTNKISYVEDLADYVGVGHNTDIALIINGDVVDTLYVMSTASTVAEIEPEITEDPSTHEKTATVTPAANSTFVVNTTENPDKVVVELGGGKATLSDWGNVNTTRGFVFKGKNAVAQDYKITIKLGSTEASYGSSNTITGLTKGSSMTDYYGVFYFNTAGWADGDYTWVVENTSDSNAIVASGTFTIKR